MQEVLDYAAPPQKVASNSLFCAIGVLVAVWIVYAVACGPAIAQRGYPPIDARLQGMTLLWLIGGPLTALFNRWSRARMWVLAIYAMATGFIDAASWPMMVPNHFNLGMVAVTTLIFFGPIHLAVILLSELVCRKAIVVVTWFLGEGILDIKVRAAACVLLLCLAALLPSAYVVYHGWSLNRNGRQMADRDWAEGNVRSIRATVESVVGDVRVEEFCDRVSGFKFFNPHFAIGWGDAYDKRVAELVKLYGRPATAAPEFPTSAEIVRLLDADGFTEIKALPYDVTPDITVFRGSHSKWGGTSSSGTPSVDTRRGGLIGMGGTAKAFFVTRDSKVPGVVFVRGGNECVLVLADDGRLLAWAVRN